MDILEQLLSQAFAAEGLDPALAVVSPSERPDLADFQSNGVFLAAKAARINPRALAERIVERLKHPDITFEVAGPGYINMTLGPALLEKMLLDNSPIPQVSGRIVLDFGGPNVAKPMHVGHMRSLVIGDALQRILRFVGYEVLSDIHLGDWGLQMGLLLAALEGTPLHDYNIALLEKTYPQAAALAKEDEPFRLKAQMFTRLLQQGDPELMQRWRKMVCVSMTTVNRELAALKVNFTLMKGESDVQDLIPDMIASFVAKGIVEEDNGALVVRVGEPPLILRKSDGAALYSTTDLATILDRKAAFDPDKIIYVTDERQQLHFKQVFAAAEMAGYLNGKLELEHIWFGTVNDANGKPLKTRAGGVPKLHDLIEEAITKASEKNAESAIPVAMAALKFADLQNPRTGSYSFDLDKFLSFEGKTGPYLLYQAVRIKSILVKSVEPGPITLETAQERALAFKLVFGFRQALDGAVRRLSPKEIADHAYDLAQSFSKYYANTQIGESPSRVALSAKVLAQLECCLGLMGIDIPERM
jgi:arginyl-tRNA synthetase